MNLVTIFTSKRSPERRAEHALVVAGELFVASHLAAATRAGLRRSVILSRRARRLCRFATRLLEREAA